MRTLACAALALLLGTGIALADKGDKAKGKGKRGHGAFGTIKKIDGNTLTVEVRGKKGSEPTVKTFKVEDDTKVTIRKGEEKTEKTFKQAIKDADIKQGGRIFVRLSEDGKVVGLGVGGGRRPGGKKPKTDK